MNSLLNQLKPYPFARLCEAMQGLDAPAGIAPVPLYIGEPKHLAPKVVTDALADSLTELSAYPFIAGLLKLRRLAGTPLRRFAGWQRYRNPAGIGQP